MIGGTEGGKDGLGWSEGEREDETDRDRKWSEGQSEGKTDRDGKWSEGQRVDGGRKGQPEGWTD